MTADEFIDWDSAQTDRHELVRGEVVAMVGGTLAHAMVVIRVARLIGNHLEGSGCRVFSESTKVRLSDDTVFLPDVFVTCQRTKPDSSTIADDPVLVIEVTSPSTSDYDHGTKFAHYRRLASLAQYVMIDPVNRTVESYLRNTDGSWQLSEAVTGAQITFSPIELTLAVADVFSDLAD